MPIADRLNKARQSLLDLTARNRLLHVPQQGKATRVIHVHEELSCEVFRLLVVEQKALQFEASIASAPAAAVEEVQHAVLPENSEPSDEEIVVGVMPPPMNVSGERPPDLKLQTRLTPDGLQKRLLAMYYDARTLLEEQGVNVLYLALGQLRWYDSPESELARFAPLLLVPVTLERRAVGGRFSIRWDKEDLAENLSLAAKLKSEFGLLLPSFEFSEEFNPQAYFDEVESALAGSASFQVQRDDIALAFFSFAKFLMYRDLDASVWPEGRRIDVHPKIVGLLRDGFPNALKPLPDDANLDELVPPSTRMHVVDADGSQTLVIAEVQRGSDLVVQGPPGTGKSQTITNLIASAIHAGKTVLFVAEKLAALEVVKRNLARIGLDQLALELHSNKAHKRAVLDEIARTLSLSAPSAAPIRDQSAPLGELTALLNQHVQALHTLIGASELNAYQVIGGLARLGTSQRDYAELRLSDVARWPHEAREQAQRALRDLATRMPVIGAPELHPWRGVALSTLLPGDAALLARRAGALLQPFAGLQQQVHSLAAMLQQPVPATLRASAELARLAVELAKLPAIERATLNSSIWAGDLEPLRQLIGTGRRYQQLHAQLSERVREDALARDWTQDKQAFLLHGQSLFRWFQRPYREAMQQLGLALKGEMPKRFADRRELWDRLDAARQLRTAIEGMQPLGQAAFGSLWRQFDSAWDALEAQVRWVEGFRALNLPSSSLALAARLEDPQALGAQARQLQEATALPRSELHQLAGDLQLVIRDAFGVEQLDEVPFAELDKRLQAWATNADSLAHWLPFHRTAQQLLASPLQPFHANIVQRRLAPEHCADAFDQAYFHALLRVALASHPELAQFEGHVHSQQIARYASMDRAQLAWSRHTVGVGHLAQLPRSNTGVGALGIVHREIQKKRGNLPIRKLLAKAGTVIQQAKPLFMMSPLSVAQFLQPGVLEFDLLIIDEASQVEPVDALGAIARCRQIIVVGDDKQLPPTRFFSRMTGNDEEVEDEAEVQTTTTVESILGLCAAMGVPDKMLRWHYRSRHHSLIAVSNQQFYQRLYLVPSPEIRPEALGVKFHEVAGVYDRGKTRQNKIEAAAIVQAMLQFAEHEPNKTLGVVAFSEAQKQAILDLLEAERRLRPDLEAFFASSRLEPCFVKNLENVQGDERDVIMISIGYARDADGQMSMGFGPLSAQGGERRLNVLISRARQRCEVYSSITSEDIDISRSASVGTRVLKLYLKFAETGQMELAPSARRAADSEFEAALQARLEQAGHQVHALVGSAGLFIDLAILDPEHPGRYLLGIECDGAAYQAARSARDRDRLRPAVLEDHGWRIQRVWCADWLLRPVETMSEALAAIDAALQEAATPQLSEAVEPPALPSAFTALTSPEAPLTPEPMQVSQPYLEAHFAVPKQYEIHELPSRELAELIVRIVELEQPIHEEEITQRIRTLWGLARTGRRITDAVAQALAQALSSQQVRREDLNFLIAGQSATQIRDRSQVESRTLRTAPMLPPSEIRLAILKLVEISHSLSAPEVAPSICRWLGFRSTSAELRELVDREVANCLAQGLLIEAEGSLRLP